MKRYFLKVILALSLTILGQTKIAQSVTEIHEGNIIRDSEIETFLHDITEPIFRVAGLDLSPLNLYVVASSEVNAAASIENSIFINTGLILKVKSLEELIGVLAHETGHLALGHLARLEESMRRSSLMAMASAALGIAAALAGQPDIGIGGMMIGTTVAQQSLMHYSRGQEASADQAAIRLLNKLGWSAKGLQDFMNYLSKQELRSVARQDAYLQTHPLSATRVELLRGSLKNSPHLSAKLPASFYKRFKRILIKIKAFLSPPITILMQHPPSQTSLLDRYARAIAYYRNHELSKSLQELEFLIKATPQDAYLYELKGQILFENGKGYQAYEAYKKALSLAPHRPLIRLSYVQTMLELPNHSNHNIPLKELKKILKKEWRNPLVWHFLAITYGRMGIKGQAALALSEKALTLDDLEQAEKQAKRALHISQDRSVRLRAGDILKFVTNERKKRPLL